ncbi:hypothetical protein JXA12_04495 [Candidatus Woesearchaeota archaeon]|nr:hypothetical protein [Candidatus Woesearchaeota archaeon]
MPAKKKPAKRSAKERRRAPAVYLAAAVIIVIALILIFYYKPWQLLFPGGEDDLSSYNNYDLAKREDGLWYVRIVVNDQPYQVAMHHHPIEVELIPAEQDAVDVIRVMANRAAKGYDSEAIIAMDPEAPGALVIAGVEIARVVGEKFNIFNIPTSSAFTKQPTSGATATPVLDCRDADEDTAVILIRVADDDRVAVPTNHPTCVVVQATTANKTIQAADRFVYALFGVIPAS